MRIASRAHRAGARVLPELFGGVQVADGTGDGAEIAGREFDRDVGVIERLLGDRLLSRIQFRHPEKLQVALQSDQFGESKRFRNACLHCELFPEIKLGDDLLPECSDRIARRRQIDPGE